MRIRVYATCWNSADILPFFLRHYEQFAESITVYDNFSDDGSYELLQCHPLVTLERFDTDGKLRDDVVCRFKNECWKSDAERTDWSIVCDIDEFIWHRNLQDRLQQASEAGHVMLRLRGYEMFSSEFPADSGQQLWSSVVTGEITRPQPGTYGMNKPSLFRPQLLTATNFFPGAHHAAPSLLGVEATITGAPDILLLHYQRLGWERQQRRYAAYRTRLSDENRLNGWASQYDAAEHEHKRYWDWLQRVVKPLSPLVEAASADLTVADSQQ
jgi:hypothetical protein